VAETLFAELCLRANEVTRIPAINDYALSFIVFEMILMTHKNIFVYRDIRNVSPMVKNHGYFQPYP
ncbi:hypothetical protein THOM_1740, partial [Trachipleistophora hominis]